MKPSKMLNLSKPSFKPKHSNNVIGRFKHDARCKKHPKHHQSPGVCSLCLRERLSQIPTSSTSSRLPPPSSTATSSSVSSLSSYYSSSSASSCASPSHPKTISSFSIFFFNAKHGLVKSRSMAVGDDNNAAKKGGFLFKLLRPKHKRMDHNDAKLIPCRSVRGDVTVAS